MKRLYKSRNKMFMGVCGGVAEYLNTDPTIIRILYVFLTLFTGVLLGLVAYIICGVVIPEDNGII